MEVVVPMFVCFLDVLTIPKNVGYASLFKDIAGGIQVACISTSSNKGHTPAAPPPP